MKLAVIYASQTGHTREMGEVIAEGIRRTGCEVRLFSIDEPVPAEYLEACCGIIVGTPTWGANACWPMERWLTEGCRGLPLAGKLGGVYATAHYAQGGADIALLSMIGHLMVKGLLLYSGGASLGKPFIHLGPVALDAVGTHYEDCREDFRIYGERFARKALEFFGD